jgi:hemolysin D
MRDFRKFPNFGHMQSPIGDRARSFGQPLLSLQQFLTGIKKRFSASPFYFNEPLDKTLRTKSATVDRRRWASRKIDLEFLPPAAEITETPPSPIRVWLARTICVLITIALSISWFGKIDVYATAPGRIQPIGRSKIVQPLNSGTVSKIYVREGSRVNVGTPVIDLDPTEAQAEELTAADRVEALVAEIARRHSLLNVAISRPSGVIPRIAFPPGVDQAYRMRETELRDADYAKIASSINSLEAKIAESLARKTALEVSIHERSATLETLNRRVAMRSELQRQGWDSEANVLDAMETLNREQEQQASDIASLPELDADVNNLRKQEDQTIYEFRADYTQGLEKAENDLDVATQSLTKQSRQTKYTRLISPISGTVQQMTITNAGQVVLPGQQLMTIVPQDNHLEIEALMKSEDVGFVQVGQRAVIKIDAFPFTRYGTVSGTVIHVSRDSLQQSEAQSEADTQEKPVSSKSQGASAIPAVASLVFPIIVSLDSTSMEIDGKSVPLLPGMTATVEIKTTDRRVIDFVLSPVVELVSGAAHER